MSNQTCFPQRYWSPCGRAYKSTRRVIEHRQRLSVFDHASRGEALAPALRRGAASWPTGAHVRRPGSRPRICRHGSQATSFDGRQLTRYSTQKFLMLSPAFTQVLFQVVLPRFLDARRWCGERGSERALASSTSWPSTTIHLKALNVAFCLKAGGNLLFERRSARAAECGAQ